MLRAIKNLTRIYYGKIKIIAISDAGSAQDCAEKLVFSSLLSSLRRLLCRFTDERTRVTSYIESERSSLRFQELLHCCTAASDGRVTTVLISGPAEVFAPLSKRRQPRIIPIYIFMRRATLNHCRRLLHSEMHRISKYERTSDVGIPRADALCACDCISFIFRLILLHA